MCVAKANTSKMLVTLFIIILRYCRVKCQMEKSIIWDKNQQDFVQLYNDSRFRDFRRQTISTRQDLHMKDISGKVLRASYYEVLNRSLISIWIARKFEALFRETQRILHRYTLGTGFSYVLWERHEGDWNLWRYMEPARISSQFHVRFSYHV